jgi:hypothetical protein
MRATLIGDAERIFGGENSVTDTITTKHFVKFLIKWRSFCHFCFENVGLMQNLPSKMIFKAPK